MAFWLRYIDLKFRGWFWWPARWCGQLGSGLRYLDFPITISPSDTSQRGQFHREFYFYLYTLLIANIYTWTRHSLRGPYKQSQDSHLFTLIYHQDAIQ